jgi:hypothetical protein
MLVSTNPRTERSAVLVSPASPTAMMQFFRVVQEAENLNRRIFQNAGELVAWLSEVLTAEETARVRAMLLD